MLLALILDILRNRPLINLVLSIILGRIQQPMVASTTTQLSNQEVWEIIRSPDGRISKVIIHRKVRKSYEPSEEIEPVMNDYGRVIELE